MIEKLFKGKRKDNNEWIVSNSILQTNCGGVRLWFQGDWVEVIPKTVGQYKNLDDNCNAKIFEGDIILCNYKNCRNEDGTKDIMVIEEGVDGYLQGEYLVGLGRYDLLKVIGNIHDNPEILNDKKYNDITIRCECETIHCPNCGFEIIEE